MGLPDTMSSLWQQIGRAGRRQTSSLAVIIGQERPLDQHYMRHPDEVSALLGSKLQYADYVSVSQFADLSAQIGAVLCEEGS